MNKLENVNPSRLRTQTLDLNHTLLKCGIAAGPIYIVVGLLEVLLRPGFDIRRHALSLMSNGDWGWVHVLMLIGTGLLTMAGALGLWRAFGYRWSALMLALYGLGLVGAGIFPADPAPDFPLNQTAASGEITTQGILHFATGGVGFLGLIAACLIFAYQFARAQQKAWSLYSLATGILFFAAFFGIMSAGQFSGTMLTFVLLAFTGAVILAWLWISLLLAKLLGSLS